jgi:hypothetical protein
MSYNVISGTLPQGLTDLSKIELISIKSNKIKGKIPSFDETKWERLKMFFVEKNQLEGYMNSYCSLGNVSLTADCLEDSVVCTCCTQCCLREGVCI